MTKDFESQSNRLQFYLYLVLVQYTHKTLPKKVTMPYKTEIVLVKRSVMSSAKWQSLILFSSIVIHLILWESLNRMAIISAIGKKLQYNDGTSSTIDLSNSR